VDTEGGGHVAKLTIKFSAAKFKFNKFFRMSLEHSETTGGPSKALRKQQLPVGLFSLLLALLAASLDRFLEKVCFFSLPLPLPLPLPSTPSHLLPPSSSANPYSSRSNLIDHTQKQKLLQRVQASLFPKLELISAHPCTILPDLKKETMLNITSMVVNLGLLCNLGKEFSLYKNLEKLNLDNNSFCSVRLLFSENISQYFKISSELLIWIRFHPCLGFYQIWSISRYAITD
jgi:hypothetical protein